MHFYKIANILTPVEEYDTADADTQYVAVVNENEWNKYREQFHLSIDIDLNPVDALETKIVVNYNALTGNCVIPDRTNIHGNQHMFAFALNEHGIVLIDNSDYVVNTLEKIRSTKKWCVPCMERFLYDLLEDIIEPDIRLLENIEHQLNLAEEAILNGSTEIYQNRINDIRGDLVDLKLHYDQLLDIGQELMENENGFFKQENMHFFRLFTDRVIRLQERVTSLRDYIVQLRDLSQSMLAEKQNHVMSILTIISSIFMPLTLIAGWYGMNFQYMPELQWKWAYPAICIISFGFILICLIWLKKKKWL